MNKLCLFLLCALFVVQTKCDCADNFLKCFSEFADTFFQNISEIEHVNATKQNLPQDFKQVRDIELKNIEKITDSIQDELFKQLKQNAGNDAVIVTDNPKTHIYVKTFSYNFGKSFFPDFENIDLDGREDQSDESDQINESDENGEIKQFSFEDETISNNSSDINSNKNNVKDIITGNYTRIKEENLSNASETLNNDEKEDQDKPEILRETSISNNDYKENEQTENSALITTQATDIIIENNKPEPIITTEGSVLKQEEQKIHKDKTITNQNNNITIKTVNENLQKPHKIVEIPNNRTYNKNQKETTENRSLTQTTTAHIAYKNFDNKQFEKDIRENLIQSEDENDYNTEDASDYPQIDYIDLYKDTTNEENEYVPTDNPKTDDIKDEIVENIEEYSLEIDTELNDTYAYDKVMRNELWSVLSVYGVKSYLVQALKSFYEGSSACLKIHGSYTEWFNIRKDVKTSFCHGNTSEVSNVFPWIATIFIKNDTANNQFNYICDGALLSDKLLISAARCVNFFNSTVKPDDVLVFLGKRSLQIMGEDEKSVRISKIMVHGNFSNGEVVENDLALLELEEPVQFTDSIRPACLGVNEELLGKSASTAWELTGALTPVFFEKNKNENCVMKNASDSTFCATYGNEVALCPSYGGIYATRRAGRWFLHAIRSGDTTNRGICFSKDVLYTPLGSYQDWIMENIK